MGEIIAYIAMGTGWTAVMTFGSAAIGIVLGLPMLALAQSRFSVLRGIYHAIVHVVRGVPTIVWLFIAFFGVGQLGLTLSPVAASLLVLSIIAAAYMAEIYRGGIQAIPAGQWEAANALNLDRLSTLRFIIGPQLFRAVSPSVATQIIGLLKDSALVSTIGVADLVFRAGIMTQYHAHGLYMFGIAGLIYLALSLPIAAFSRSIHARITRRYALA
ncbi:amino acid ABC transporter permease [Brevibacterium oceani]|uniref:amino acid ABC transporter permease n=1 Tax=Brevibacterium oceani TaxID=358099 RepID=UPI0015E65A18|nr:amino acid ABC transporter permease [Brevibacterium oceani]